MTLSERLKHQATQQTVLPEHSMMLEAAIELDRKDADIRILQDEMARLYQVIFKR